MKINLWVLIDKSKRIYYTGYTKKLVKEQKPVLGKYIKDLKIVKLKGEYK